MTLGLVGSDPAELAAPSAAMTKRRLQSVEFIIVFWSLRIKRIRCTTFDGCFFGHDPVLASWLQDSSSVESKPPSDQ
jgi:hypothetical protein